MNPNLDRAKATSEIAKNIATDGYHLYMVAGGSPLPRYLYTIGLSGVLGFELIFAGAVMLTDEAAVEVIRSTVSGLRQTDALNAIEIGGMSYSLCPAQISWAKRLALGAFDYFRVDNLVFRQIVPPSEIATIDVPQMAVPYSSGQRSVWRWLELPWEYPVSYNAIVGTNFPALKGGAILEASRWEEEYWEMFVGDVASEQAENPLIVGISILLGYDPSLEPALTIPLEKGIYRESAADDWYQMGVGWD